jgi:hypothetical protein
MPLALEMDPVFGTFRFDQTTAYCAFRTDFFCDRFYKILGRAPGKRLLGKAEVGRFSRDFWESSVVRWWRLVDTVLAHGTQNNCETFSIVSRYLTESSLTETKHGSAIGEAIIHHLNH